VLLFINFENLAIQNILEVGSFNSFIFAFFSCKTYRISLYIKLKDVSKQRKTFTISQYQLCSGSSQSTIYTNIDKQSGNIHTQII